MSAADDCNKLTPAVAARLYASGEFGAAWPIFPVDPVSKRPHPMLGKRPPGEGGFKCATADHVAIAAWWSIDPDAGIGVDLGRAGLAAVDVEGQSKGFDVGETLNKVCDAVRLPATLTASTAGGGLHLIYAVPAGAHVPTRIVGADGVPIAGVEIRRPGHYIVVPPGPGRDWVNVVAPVPAPSWMAHAPPQRRRRRIEPRRFNGGGGTKRGLGALARAVAKTRSATSPSRHNTFVAEASWVFERVASGDLDGQRAFDEMTAAAIESGLPGDEIDDILGWAIRSVGGAA